MAAAVGFCLLLLSSCYWRRITTINGGDDDDYYRREMLALVSIKETLTDPVNSLAQWRRRNLGEEDDHCNWTGVFCRRGSHGRVVYKLDLSNMSLSGHLSPAIVDLPSLTSLDLSLNDFSGDLHGISGLTFLNASSNNFCCVLPTDLANATSMEFLDLRGNFFTGKIPAYFNNLRMLKFLGLAGNNLSGEIPPELGQLVSLQSLILGFNRLEGVIPAELANLTNLRLLDLAVGGITGRIPAAMGDMKLLSTIFLYHNSLEGCIPPAIANCSSLEVLDLSDNLLACAIPEKITELRNLRLLSLMRNRLSGPIPVTMAELHSLQVLELWSNSLSGSIPTDLGLTSPLIWFDVSSNLLSGDLPPAICHRSNLQKLIVFNNAFSGAIPPELTKCASLVRFRAQNNAINGVIPAGFGHLPVLERLEISNNCITGEIPPDIASSSSLTFIDFSRNQLRSSLPPGLFAIKALQQFFAFGNELTGEMTDDLFSPRCPPSLCSLHLSSNLIHGVIPGAVASCHGLVTLNLSGNWLSGEIPTAMASMSALALLDLSNNSLAGTIPDAFCDSTTLESVNFSHNKLRGVLPTRGVLRTIIGEDEVAGNDDLCGGVLPPCDDASPPRIYSTLVVTTEVSAIAAACIALVCFSRWVYRSWPLIKNGFHEMLLQEMDGGGGAWPWRMVTFQRLDFTSGDILNQLKESCPPRPVGVGGSGVVYKVDVPGTAVAVKLVRRSGAAEGGVEVELLGRRLRHRNIIKVMGYLYNDIEAMMVCEFMPNGCLGEALHKKRLLEEWVARYNVAAGVARGLAYLHHDCRPGVIHRDLKPSNILLDACFEPRIADFGLARLMADGKDGALVSMVAGSYGYIAPECGYTLKVDEKTDVYSFGVVLMELVTGRRAADEAFGEQGGLVAWVQGQGRALAGAVDPGLRKKVEGCSHGHGECEKEQMVLVLQIALLCVSRLPRDRPYMRDVVKMLEEAKSKRKSCCIDKPSPSSPLVLLQP